MATLLPLFPLDVVLLPGMPFPLHIFEPRYKEMIAECLARKEFFGVVRVKDDEVADIGCTAEILSVTKTYDDGKLDILTQGRRRFEVMAINQERSFLRAEVIYLNDEAGKTVAGEVERADQLHLEIMTLAGMGEGRPSETKPEDFSFYLAASLPLDLDFKQNLLGMKSEAERLQALIAYFEEILPKLRRSVQARNKAEGNGHVH